MAITLVLGEEDEETFLEMVEEDLERPLTDEEAKRARMWRSMGYSVSYVWWKLGKSAGGDGQ